MDQAGQDRASSWGREERHVTACGGSRGIFPGLIRHHHPPLAHPLDSVLSLRDIDKDLQANLTEPVFLAVQCPQTPAASWWACSACLCALDQTDRRSSRVFRLFERPSIQAMGAKGKEAHDDTQAFARPLGFAMPTRY